MSDTPSFLADFGWQQESRSWVGSLKLASGFVITVTIRAASSSLKEVSPASRSMLERLISSENEIRQTVASSVVDEINNHWRNKPGRIKTKQIARRLEPIELLIGIDGSVKLIYSDDDLFWGHALCVQLSPTGTLESTYVLDFVDGRDQ